MSTSDKLAILFGATVAVVALSLLIWRCSGAAPVAVPKPRRHAELTIDLQVCGWQLHDVRRWTDLLPMCSFELEPLGPGDYRCAKTPTHGNTLVQGRPPQRGDIRWAASTETWMAEVEGMWRTPELDSQGRPVDRPVGLISGTRATVPAGASDLVGAHELGHVCGYEHAVQGEGSHVWAPGQIMSMKDRRQGHGIAGMDRQANEYQPALGQ